jgi:hypothetical protein
MFVHQRGKSKIDRRMICGINTKSSEDEMFFFRHKKKYNKNVRKSKNLGATGNAKDEIALPNHNVGHYQ